MTTHQPLSYSARQAASYKLKIISGTSNPALAAEIAKSLGEVCAEIEIKRFADNEIGVQIKENVRGCDVFVVQSCSTPVNDNLMELFLIIDALKRASANRITAVIPYYGYARQDRKTRPRVPISAALVAHLLETAGVDRVLSVDLHCGQIQGFFKQPVDNLFAYPILCHESGKLIKSFIESASKAEQSSASTTKSAGSATSTTITPESATSTSKSAESATSTSKSAESGAGEKKTIEITIVSPDAGGVERADLFRKAILTQHNITSGMAVMNKSRVEANKISKMELVGSVKGTNCIIIDDMIDTAGTLCAAAQILKDNGALRVFACATHALLNEPAVSNIAKSCLEMVFVANTVPIPPTKQHAKIIVVSVGQLIAEAIRRVHIEESLSVMF